MPIEDSESHEMMQIKMAAQGSVSGTLAEWPHLKHALRKRGVKMLDTANAEDMRRWMKVRSISDGCWITLNMDAIATIAPCGYGFSMRMLGGQSIILDKEEGIRP